jgi:hypothetical protein
MEITHLSSKKDMSTYMSTHFYRIYREFNSLKSHATGSSVKLRNFFPFT